MAALMLMKTTKTMTLVKMNIRMTKMRLITRRGWVLSLCPKKALRIRKITLGTIEAAERYP